MRNVHGEGEKRVICSLCGKGFSTLLRAQKHEEVCQATSSNGQDIPQQKKEAKKEFQCPKCLKKFAGKGLLNIHTMRIHSNVRPFICGQCSKGFKTKSELTKHEGTHGESSLQCDLCELKLANPATLKHHRMTHTGERPHLCPYCHHGFIQPNDCKKHILKIHGVVVPKGMNVRAFSDLLSKEDE